jgi:hypothetical protein
VTGPGCEEKLAKNQAVLREVNERIRELPSGFGRPPGIDLVCECSDTGCGSMIHVSVEEYEAVRSFSTHFLIQPGHHVPHIERVVGRGQGYEIVEKQGDAASLVESLDPRRRVKADDTER